MFKLSKKQKCQEVENEKMNENVEKNVDISDNTESVFPDAKDALETAQNQW